MENLIVAAGAVLPMFLMIAVGFVLARIRLLDDTTAKKMNNVVFRCFLPIMLFYNIYTTDLQTALNLPLMGYAIASVVTAFLVLLLIVPLLEKQNAKRGVLVQGVFRSNFVLFGIPMVATLFEETGVTSMLISVVVPLFNVLAVIALELFRGGKIHAKKILIGVCTNPLVLASAAGLLCLALGFRFPGGIHTVLRDMGRAATPLALVILGASFSVSKLRGNRRELLFGVVGKLVAYPLVFLTIAILLGYRGIELASLLALFASPAAVSSFTMAQQMGGDADLAGELVVLGSAASALTIFLWVFALRSLGFL